MILKFKMDLYKIAPLAKTALNFLYSFQISCPEKTKKVLEKKHAVIAVTHSSNLSGLIIGLASYLKSKKKPMPLIHELWKKKALVRNFLALADTYFIPGNDKVSKANLSVLERIAQKAVKTKRPILIAPQGSLNLPEARSIKSVSYTHLTLPTKA